MDNISVQCAHFTLQLHVIQQQRRQPAWLTIWIQMYAHRKQMKTYNIYVFILSSVLSSRSPFGLKASLLCQESHLSIRRLWHHTGLMSRPQPIPFPADITKPFSVYTLALLLVLFCDYYMGLFFFFSCSPGLYYSLIRHDITQFSNIST